MFKNLIFVSLVATFFSGCGQEVKSIAVDPSLLRFDKRDQSKQLEAIAQDIKGATIPDVLLSYSSENASVATVDSTGLVEPKSDGSTAIIVEGPLGVRGETFVKVCLPQDIICDPTDKLEIEVERAGPLLCHAIDCNGKKLSAKVELTSADPKIAKKEGDSSFRGVSIGETAVDAKVHSLTKKLSIVVTEQAEPPEEKRHYSKKRKNSDESSSPYGKSSHDHILDNMKF